SSTFSLSSQAGYDSTYVIHAPAAPAGLVFASPSAGSLSADAATWTILVPNALNATAKAQSVNVQMRDAAAQAPTAESLDTAIVIQLGELQKGVATLPIEATVTASIHAMDLAKRVPDALPSNVKLSFLSADGLRALHAADAISEAQLDSASDALLEGVQANLTRALGPTTSSAAFDDASLHAAPSTPYKTDPPVLWVAHAKSSYAIPGDGAQNADLALAIGATAKFDLNLPQSSERASAITLKAPPSARFLAASGAGGALSSDGKSAAFQVPAGSAGSVPVHLEMRSATAPTFSAEKADLGVLVDLKDLDITIGKAIKGDFGALDVDVTVTGKLGVIKVPDDLKSSFSQSLALDYLSSDALRMLKERGILDAANLSKLEEQLRSQIATNLE